MSYKFTNRKVASTNISHLVASDIAYKQHQNDRIVNIYTSYKIIEANAVILANCKFFSPYGWFTYIHNRG